MPSNLFFGDWNFLPLDTQLYFRNNMQLLQCISRDITLIRNTLDDKIKPNKNHEYGTDAVDNHTIMMILPAKIIDPFWIPDIWAATSVNEPVATMTPPKIL